MILLPRSSWSREYGDGASVDTALSDGSGSAGDGMSDSTSTSEPPPDVDDMHASLNATDASKVAELVETTIAAIPQIYQSPDHDASSPATPLTPRYLSDYATESDDDFLVVVRRPNSPRLFSWPCPFALSDPHAHALCLRHEHATARAVLWHMFRHHLRAPCCYRCGATFDYFVERNSHLAARTCEVKTLPVLEGIGEGMVYELQDLVGSWDRRHELDESFELLADERKYAQIWRVIFPAEEFHERFPVGARGEPLVKVVQAARGYWSRNGKGILERAFGDGKARYELDELYAVVLDQIVRRMLLDAARSGKEGF